MTQRDFLFPQLTATVPRSLHRGSARGACPGSLHAPLPLAPPTPARARYPSSPLEFLCPGLETLPSPGEF